MPVRSSTGNAIELDDGLWRVRLRVCCRSRVCPGSSGQQGEGAGFGAGWNLVVGELQTAIPPTRRPEESAERGWSDDHLGSLSAWGGSLQALGHTLGALQVTGGLWPPWLRRGVRELQEADHAGLCVFFN